MIALNSPKHRFEIGQVVVHRRYSYRGVVVSVDRQCQAPEDWYVKNQTLPDRLQPWYHVLVDGGAITYPAESSLMLDGQRSPITHSLIDTFFDSFDGQAYVRNDRPWPAAW